MPLIVTFQERVQQQEESLRATQERVQQQDESLHAAQERIQQQEATLTAVQEQKTQLEQEIQGYRAQIEQDMDEIHNNTYGLYRWVDDIFGTSLRSTQEQSRQRHRDGGSLTDVELRLIGASSEPIVIDSDDEGDEEQHDDNETGQEPQSNRTEGNISRKRKRAAYPAVEDDVDISAGNAARTRSSSNVRA